MYFRDILTGEGECNFVNYVYAIEIDVSLSLPLRPQKRFLRVSQADPPFIYSATLI